MDELREIFGRITEHHNMPLRIGSRCESKVYYRVEDISWDDLTKCAEYVTERIEKVCSPNLPDILIDLHSGFTGLAIIAGEKLAELGEAPKVLRYDELKEGSAEVLKGKNIVIVNEVITTARSCLEAHSRITVLGGSVFCWAALIDRTFGPGPVPVVAAFTGEPVQLVDRFA